MALSGWAWISSEPGPALMLIGLASNAEFAEPEGRVAGLGRG